MSRDIAAAFASKAWNMFEEAEDLEVVKHSPFHLSDYRSGLMDYIKRHTKIVQDQLTYRDMQCFITQALLGAAVFVQSANFDIRVIAHLRPDDQWDVMTRAMFAMRALAKLRLHPTTCLDERMKATTVQELVLFYVQRNMGKLPQLTNDE